MKITFSLIIFVFLSSSAFAASKEANVKAGNKFYAAGKFEESLNKYNAALARDSESDVINFNAGTAAYKKGDFAKSVEHLRKALLSDQKELSQKTHYNLGNALYRFGMTKEKDDLQAAVGSLEESLAHYQKALDLKSDDADAKFNYDFVKKELEELKKKLEQQPKTCPNPKKDQSQDQENEEKSQSQQNQQQQSSEPKEQSGQEQKEQEQQSQSSPEEQKQSQSGSQQNSEEQSHSQQSQQSSAGAEPKKMSEKEAERFLDSYQQSQEPKGLLNFRQFQRKDKEVTKDW